MLPTFDPGFSTPPMSAVWDVGTRFSHMITFERTLAHVQAELGLVPAAAARAIEAACSAVVLADPETIAREGWEAGTPLNPLLARIKRHLTADHAAHLHRGATTQDAVDTAAMLQLRDAHALLLRDLTPLVGRLTSLAHEHRATPMIARTLLQHALPTTFGLTVARWLSPLVASARAIERAHTQLPVQLGGAVGALGGFGGASAALAPALARALGLVAPTLPWHADRAPLLAALAPVADLMRALGKLALDLVLLAQSDVGELRMRGGGSSSMPHKQNPIDAVRARAAAQASLQLLTGLYVGPAQELDRAAAGWHLEWLLVPLVLQTAAAALEATNRAIDGLEVDVAKMAKAAGDQAPPESCGPLIDAVREEAETWLRERTT